MGLNRSGKSPVKGDLVQVYGTNEAFHAIWKQFTISVMLISGAKAKLDDCPKAKSFFFFF